MADTLYQKLQDSEESYINQTFWDVHPLFLLVQNGDVDGLKASLDIQLEHFPAAGRISRDARKQLEYLTVSLVNTFMIAAIQGGVYPPEANWIADQALRRLSQVRDPVDIPSIISETAFQLCEMVAETKCGHTDNPHVEKAKHYLSTHLTQEIHMGDVTKAVGLSQFHLSRLFKALTGLTMREYLIRERVEAAKHLLITSDRTISQIASLFRFCDQSYFTLVFRKETGLTPGQYRDKNRIV